MKKRQDLFIIASSVCSFIFPPMQFLQPFTCHQGVTSSTQVSLGPEDLSEILTFSMIACISLLKVSYRYPHSQPRGDCQKDRCHQVVQSTLVNNSKLTPSNSLHLTKVVWICNPFTLVVFWNTRPPCFCFQPHT